MFLTKEPSLEELRKIYELMRHGKWLFCKRVVGVMLREEVDPPSNFVLQKIRIEGKEMLFIYTELIFKPFIWSKRKLDTHLEKLFSFLSPHIVETDERVLSSLEEFNKGLKVLYGSYPVKRPLGEGEEGVEFRKGGKTVSFLKDRGKPVPKWETLTVFHPLCPLPALVL